MSHSSLLVELGCEELPAEQIGGLSEGLAEGIKKALLDHGLIEEATKIEPFATPRRLAVMVHGVAHKQPNQTIERRGPAASAAFDPSGQPTKAAIGFAQSVGKSVEALERLTTDQGEWLVATIEQPGRELAEVLQEALSSLVKDMASAKSMRWREGDERFVRPVRWLVALHGQTVLPIELFGLVANNTTEGHRIHGPGPWTIKTATDYESTLESAYVIASISKRQSVIEAQVSRLAKDHGLVLDEGSAKGLMLTNTQLTEWPQAVLGSFDPMFLTVPEPCLISAMELHQKCFALRDNKGALSPHFIAIANIESQDVSAMRQGFERVIRPRLSDAQFFWNQDRQVALADRRQRLDQVLFQKDLGSIGQKVSRMEALVHHLAEQLGEDAAKAQQAVSLCKCDLLTEMVGEFPELQGTMGYYYGLEGGVSEDVALAVGEHYCPRNAGDHLPTSRLGSLVALADRADTLVGIFGVGAKPKGSKDPFALRRAALGVIRLLEVQEKLSLRELLHAASQPLAEQLGWAPAHQSSVVDEVFDFCMERARSHAADQGIQTLTFNAVVATDITTIFDLMARAHAVERLLKHPDIEKLIAANKRLANLLSQHSGALPETIDTQLLVDAQERDLLDVWEIKKDAIAHDVQANNYDKALVHLASLATPLDAFFEHVMVMSEDLAVRSNRLAMLNQMRSAFLMIADLAKLGR